jgi:hypothetical protein
MRRGIARIFGGPGPNRDTSSSSPAPGQAPGGAVEDEASSAEASPTFKQGLGDPLFAVEDPTIEQVFTCIRSASCRLIVRSIIAVHGLNGDQERTWTEGNVFWLRDLLPHTLRSVEISARVFSYGYNADTHSKEAVSVQDLWGHGESLLAEVVMRRGSDGVSCSENWKNLLSV